MFPDKIGNSDFNTPTNNNFNTTNNFVYYSSNVNNNKNNHCSSDVKSNDKADCTCDKANGIEGNKINVLMLKNKIRYASEYARKIVESKDEFENNELNFDCKNLFQYSSHVGKKVEFENDDMFTNFW